MERLESADCRCDVCGLHPGVQSLGRSSQLVAESPAMQALLRRAARFAATDAPIVILGDSGTGKEMVARVLHSNSLRKDKPFVAVNVAALPAELLESELFGHAKGAFTGATGAKKGLFEVADGGTLFLDEIGEMPFPLQAKLLRALQDGEIRRVGETRSFGVDARIVCATHRDLAERVADGQFREDLYYRLKVLTLRVPPLRDRPEDIAVLTRHFLAAQGRPDVRLAADAAAAMSAYRWPGNVRELASAVQHGLALTDEAHIELEHLPEELHTRRPGRSSASPSVALRPLAEVERDHILQVLDLCDGSQTEAARVLGIGRNTLWRKLRTYQS